MQFVITSLPPPHFGAAEYWYNKGSEKSCTKEARLSVFNTEFSNRACPQTMDTYEHPMESTFECLTREAGSQMAGTFPSLSSPHYMFFFLFLSFSLRREYVYLTDCLSTSLFFSYIQGGFPRPQETVCVLSALDERNGLERREGVGGWVRSWGVRQGRLLAKWGSVSPRRRPGPAAWGPGVASWPCACR